MKGLALAIIVLLIALTFQPAYSIEANNPYSSYGRGGDVPLPDSTGGPDDYGYTWIDSNEPGGPTFEWIDITGIGTQVEGLGDDNSVGPFLIGFDFPYYWYDVDRFFIGSNGWISFSSGQNFAHPFIQLPNSNLPNDLLAVLSGDIDFKPTSDARCYYYTSPGLDSLVVSYIEVPEFADATALHTFQAILTRADSTITYQYGEQLGRFLGGQSYAFTMGMENSTGTIGLSYFYNNRNTPPPDPPPFADSTVIKFVPPESTSFVVNDIGVVNAITEGGMGVFVHPDSAVALWSDLKNFGNQTQNFYGASCVITDESQATVYTDSIISTTPIAPSEVVNFPFEDPFTAIAAGQYTAAFGGHLPPGVDLVPDNDVLEVEINAMSYPGDLSYDDGTAESTNSWNGDYSGFGSEFVPHTYPVRVENMSVSITVNAIGDLAVFVLDDDGPGGSPGTVLASDTINVSFSGLITVDFLDDNVIIEEGSFFIGAIHVLQSTLAFGMDETPPYSRRGWEFTAGWAPSRYQAENDPIIRAGVNFVLDEIVDIKEDADGDFVPDMLGQEVTIGGVLTGAAEHYGPDAAPVFIQDATAGIGLVSTVDDTIPDRAEVVVRGTLGQVDGLTIIEDPTLFHVVQYGATLPTPVELTAADLGDSVGEGFEALLARLDRVRILPTSSYPPEGEDGWIQVENMMGDTAEVFIDKDTDIDGTATPHDSVLIIDGVVGQFSQSTPPDDGYALMPRGLSDIEFAVAVEGDQPEVALPMTFSLSQNYPNPFNPQTTISYDIPSNNGEEGTRVVMKVYSIRGRFVKTLIDEVKQPGNYKVTWDGRDESDTPVVSGIYLVHMEAGDESFVRKMVLVK
jgi:hypothetical protein